MHNTLAKVTDMDPHLVREKRFLVRLDMNVPLKDGEIENDFRIRKSLPTLSWLKAHGAKIILIGHMEGDESDSLKVVYDYFSKLLDIEFVPDIYEEDVDVIVDSLPEGGMVLFENLRKWKGEKENDPAFAEHLARFADYYVNDAFSVSHREHASIVGLPALLPSYIGIQCAEEIEALSKAFEPEHPFLFVLGGAKFDTKIPLISKFLTKADKVAVVGALANVYLEARGSEVGHSLMPETTLDISDAEDEKLMLPSDVVSVGDWGKMPKNVGDLNGEDNIQDVGQDTLFALSDMVRDAALVVWNGPLGNYEEGFYTTTIEFAKMLAASGAMTIVGGGDTLAAITELDLEDQFTFVSTGGGAMLEFLLNETLPGIEAIRRSEKSSR